MFRAVLLLPALVGFAAALNIPTDPTNFGKVLGKLTLHDRQMAHALKEVSSNCNVTVDTKERTLFLDSDIGKFTAKDGQITDSNGKVSDSPPKALICLGNQEAPSTGPALMFATSGAGYLYKKTVQGSPFDFYMNKHCWAKRNKVQYYLWIGNPQDDTGFMSVKDKDALPCKDGAPGNHYFVIAGMRHLLKEKPNSWIISMDISDTFFTKEMKNVNLLDKFLDKNYDFIGGATAGGTKVFINGAIVAYRKSDWAMDFAAHWFKNRCGPMNQLAMWASLFDLWSKIPGSKFTYNQGTMSSYYGKAHDYARKAAANALTDPKDIDAHKEWCKSGKLPSNLHFPHVMVHSNMGAGGVDGVAWRADMDRTKEPFVCHNTWDRHRFSSCNAQKSMCADEDQCQC